MILVWGLFGVCLWVMRWWFCCIVSFCFRFITRVLGLSCCVCGWVGVLGLFGWGFVVGCGLMVVCLVLVILFVVVCC